MPTLFVYGTLRRGEIRHKLIEHCKFLGYGTVKGFRLFDLGDYPGAVAGSGKVHGELYEVDDKVIRWLDFVEGLRIRLFRRIEVQVNDEAGNVVSAYLYEYISDFSHAQEIEDGDWVKYRKFNKKILI